jgi:hypothetical protein
MSRIGDACPPPTTTFGPVKPRWRVPYKGSQAYLQKEKIQSTKLDTRSNQRWEARF